MRPHARRDGLLVENVGDELVIYDRERDRVHSLNTTAGLVWRNCDGERGITEIAALLAEQRGIAVPEDVVLLTLRRLQKAHLLRDTVPEIAECATFSRREMLRNLQLAGVTFLLPVVTSITAPTPAMAAYGNGGTDGGTDGGAGGGGNGGTGGTGGTGGGGGSGFLAMCLEGCETARQLCLAERPGQAAECNAGKSRCERRCRAVG
jgi:hypothetical protein